MPQLFLSVEDQIGEYERIFLEAKDRWSLDKNPAFLRVQMDCLRAIKMLRYSLDETAATATSY